MRILHLRASNFYGGPERQLCRHAELLKDSEFEIVVGSFTENGTHPALLTKARERRLETASFPVRSAYDPAGVSELVEFVRDNGVDVVCTHDYRSHILGHILKSRTNVSHVCFARGFTQENAKVRAFQLLDRILMRFADRIVAVSAAQAKYLRGWGVPARKLSVVYNSINPAAFAESSPVDLKRRFDLPDEAVVTVAAGRFSREKGQRFLVRAIDRAVSQDERLHFILFGDGPDLPQVAQWVNERGLSDHIRCPGYETNLIGCLKGADILVNPSRSEGLPNIVLEAMAVGVPVVATKVGGVPELIEDGVSGWLVEYGNEAMMSGAVAKLSQDAGLRDKFAQAAAGVIKNRFSFEKQAEELKKVYRLVSS